MNDLPPIPLDLSYSYNASCFLDIVMGTLSAEEYRRRAENWRRYATLDAMNYEYRMDCINQASAMERKAEELECQKTENTANLNIDK